MTEEHTTKEQEEEHEDSEDDESDSEEEEQEEHDEVRLGFINDEPQELALLSLHEDFPDKVGGKPV
jgi:hypothetical protein